MDPALPRLIPPARALAAALAAFACAAISSARADDPTPQSVLAAVQKTYASAPTCERIAIELRTPGPAGQPRVTRSTITVRIEPLVPAAPPAPAPAGADAPVTRPTPSPPFARSISLDLGPLHLWAADGRLVAVHERDPTTYVSTPIDPRITPAALTGVLPPIILPPHELACAAPPSADPGAQASLITALRPYADNLHWTALEQDPHNPARRTLHATCTGGTVDLDLQGTRLRSVTIDLPARQVSLTLRCTPLPLCDPAKWPIDTERRAPVEALAELKPRTGALRVGSRLPDMPITGRDGGPWAMADLVQPPPQQALDGQRPADHVVLVFLRAGHAAKTPGTPPPARPEVIRFDPARLAALLTDLREATFAARAARPTPDAPSSLQSSPQPASLVARFGLAPVLVLANPAPDEILSTLADAQKTWGPDVLWTTSARSTIDLVAPGADAAVIIADADWVLRAVIPIDPAQPADAAADQVTAALFELAPTEGPAH